MRASRVARAGGTLGWLLAVGFAASCALTSASKISPSPEGRDTSCSTDAACASGHCVDEGSGGVCCDTPCDFDCRSCLGARTGGADGTCAAVTDGTDPKELCPSAAGPTCDHGSCTAGSCKEPPSTPCGPTCIDALTLRTPGTCDADGLCSGTNAMPCPPPANECLEPACAADACSGTPSGAGKACALPGATGSCDGGGSCAGCGDGVVVPPEICDDGDDVSGDGCSHCRAVEALALHLGGHGCVKLSGGALKCWGKNLEGALGQGDMNARGDEPGELGDALTDVSLATGHDISKVAAGRAHSCAILDDGSLKCWGRNNEGQLGLGDQANRGDAPGTMGDALTAVALGTGRTALEVALGGLHTCAILDDQSVKCWGFNSDGALGLGDAASRGDTPGEMGDMLPVVALGTGRTAVALALGDFHSCALLDDSSVKCWGFGGAGELGLGDPQNRGDSPGEMGDALPAVALGTGRTALAIAAGQHHSCALLDDDSVKCWGANFAGQLGQSDGLAHGSGPGEMGDNLPPIALGTNRTAVAIAAGEAHSCALLDDEQVKCWGSNADGQLGIGTTAGHGNTAFSMGDALPEVALGTGRTALAIGAGDRHACALLDDATLKCWGLAADGQLGLGDTITRGDAPGEMGDALPTLELP